MGVGSDRVLDMRDGFVILGVLASLGFAGCEAEVVGASSMSRLGLRSNPPPA